MAGATRKISGVAAATGIQIYRARVLIGTAAGYETHRAICVETEVAST